MKLLPIYSALLLLFLSVTASSQVVNVCKTCKFSTISEAIQNSDKGTQIIIEAGTYHETQILIDKPLSIIGKGRPTVDGQFKGEIFKVSADSVIIKGIQIKNVGTSYTQDHAAIRIAKSEHFLIEDVHIESPFFGIYLEKVKNGTVRNNLITGNATKEFNSGNGIQLWQSENIEIYNNEISGVRDGIYLEFAHFCTISQNNSHDNIRYGLHFMFSNNDVYKNNIFRNNGAGVAVMFSKEIEMLDNTFIDNWGPAAYGLLLKEINDAEIIGNLFERNTVGINIEGSNRVNYRNNDFKNNGWAIKSRGACYANLFQKNNFLHNSFDLAYNGKLNDNVFNNNYWSDYTGYDLDKNGIGDIPYRPIKLFSYVVNKTPESIILMRSLFTDIINFSEKVSPAFTPDNLLDSQPIMTLISHDRN